MKPYTLDQAEADLAAAYATGDPAAIAAAAEVVDKLDTHPAPPSLHSSALWYAGQGIPVFALQVGRKVPTGMCHDCKTEPKCPGPRQCGHDQCHGVLDATLDLERITHWWTASPEANIGLATGHTFDAVDIDGPLGQQSRAERWDGIFAQIDADSVAKVLTPRPGGMHIYVPPTGDGNSGAIVPGVDYRGKGGYVVAPPSVIAPGGKDHPGSYRFLTAPDLAVHKLAQAG